MCVAERNWLKNCNGPNKNHVKSVFIMARKGFDREVQKCKRAYWVALQNELLTECENNGQEFWKTIGKIGVGHTKKKGIPMEVICDDGSISNNLHTVLSKWKVDFSSLFVDRQTDIIVDSDENVSHTSHSCDCLNENITIF